MPVIGAFCFGRELSAETLNVEVAGLEFGAGLERAPVNALVRSDRLIGIMGSVPNLVRGQILVRFVLGASYFHLLLAGNNELWRIVRKPRSAHVNLVHQLRACCLLRRGSSCCWYAVGSGLAWRSISCEGEGIVEVCKGVFEETAAESAPIPTNNGVLAVAVVTKEDWVELAAVLRRQPVEGCVVIRGCFG